jgi:hypothetical protein
MFKHINEAVHYHYANRSPALVIFAGQRIANTSNLMSWKPLFMTSTLDYNSIIQGRYQSRFRAEIIGGHTYKKGRSVHIASTTFDNQQTNTRSFDDQILLLKVISLRRISDRRSILVESVLRFSDREGSSPTNSSIRSEKLWPDATSVSRLVKRLCERCFAKA